MRVATQTSFALTTPGQWVVMTIAQLIAAFIEAHDGSMNTRRVYMYLLASIKTVELLDGRHFADLQLSEVTPVEVQRCADAFPATKTVGRGTVKLIKAAWRWGRRPNRRLVPFESQCPCTDVEVRHHRPNLPEVSPDILREIWLAGDRVPLTGRKKVHPQSVAFLRFVMLVGLRPWDEALTLQCSQLFKSGERWAIRLPKHKTVRSNGPAVRGLGEKAAEILLAQRDKVAGRGELWPGLRGKGRMSLQSVKRAWVKMVALASERIEIDQRIYVYRLRAGFAFTALEQGALLTEVKTALGHADIQSTFRYLQALPGTESATADKVAARVANGVHVTLEDVAAEIGCAPTLGDIYASIRKTRESLAQLTARKQMHSINGKWSPDRLREAALEKGVKNPTELARQLTAARQDADGEATPIDQRTVDRYWRGDRVPRSNSELVEIADFLGVSLDWLFCREPQTEPVEKSA